MVRQTSIETYHQIEREGLLSRRRWEVYSTLFEIGPATAAEISARVSKYNNPSVGDNCHARLGELRAIGCVVEVGERTCSVTGRQVIAWDVTAHLPKKFEPRQSRLQLLIQRIRDLEAENLRLEREVQRLKRLRAIRHDPSQEALL